MVNFCEVFLINLVCSCLHGSTISGESRLSAPPPPPPSFDLTGVTSNLKGEGHGHVQKQIILREDCLLLLL
jgi:hypothetical protein